jgi:glycosyltransferase involved in cell wall biosynthesis
VDILLATFNGEKYLEKQLESLDRQEDVNLRVWANDDGSEDETLRILHKWQIKGLITRISKSQRIGSTRVFLSLLAEHSDKDYVAFCDQDDVWEPRKLATQVIEMKNETPMCVISQKLHIDSAGEVIGKSKKLRHKPSFENGMIENVASGNTILLNSQAINLINDIQDPRVKHYDSWIYLLVSAFGQVVEIPLPLTNYRIHSGNSVGLRIMSLSATRISVNHFIDQNIFLYQNMFDEKRRRRIQKLELFQMLRLETNTLKKMGIIHRIGFKRQRLIDQIILILLLSFWKNSNKKLS